MSLMATSNYIRNVAIVGAGGHIGSHITQCLLRTTNLKVSAITRAGSQSTFPPGVHRSVIDYERRETMVSALQGQDCLIITLNFRASAKAQDDLIEAAASAGVPWILPNEWAPDSNHSELVKDISSLSDMPRIREKIVQLGVSSYLAIVPGLWYEWCLATPVLFGIDCVKKEAILFDHGETEITTSTWPQIGRAVAALLTLPIKPTGAVNDDVCLKSFMNSFVYIASFSVNQRQMLESVLRVTKGKESDWTIRKEPVEQRFQAGLEARKSGIDREKGRMVYSRVFYTDGAGNHEKTRGLANKILGLPKEDLDEATSIAVQMQMTRASDSNDVV